MTMYIAGMERDIERHFVRQVKALGGVAYKFVSPSHRGVSDRIVCLPGGQVWFVELKAARGVLSALQKVFASDMVALGQNYACLWSKEMVDEWVEARRLGQAQED